MSATSRRHLSKTRQSKVVRGPFDGVPQVLTSLQADTILSREVEAVVVRKESLERMTDPFVQSAMMSNNPGLRHHLPTNVRSIYNKYVVSLDFKTTAEVIDVFKAVPGLVTVAFDGATFHGKSKASVSFHSHKNGLLESHIQLLYFSRLSSLLQRPVSLRF